MSFEQILSGMVDRVDGACGAIFLDEECEYVQYFGQVEPIRHKLLGAYQGILLGRVRAAMARCRGDGVDKVVTGYETAQFITKSLKSGYYVVLMLDRAANVAKGLREIDLVSERLNEEIA